MTPEEMQQIDGMASKAADKVASLLSTHADDETRVLTDLSKNVAGVIEPVQLALSEIHASRNDRKVTLTVVICCCLASIVIPMCNFMMLQSIEKQVDELKQEQAAARLNAARADVELNALKQWLGQSTTATIEPTASALRAALIAQTEERTKLVQLVETSTVFVPARSRALKGD